MATFGEVLRKVRTVKGLSQKDLAEKTGIYVGSIRNYEQVVSEPLWSSVLRLADALEVPLDAFRYDVAVEQTITVKPKMGRPKKKEDAND